MISNVGTKPTSLCVVQTACEELRVVGQNFTKGLIIVQCVTYFYKRRRRGYTVSADFGI